ncbi:DUF3297 family protein [Parasphingopyxis marina]|uniref:DUF3297 family protein n=1 Tax=Parasphingopyxis marina TaxID=2761622 RepID=A0A842I0Y6_9SPHN|nr:DUF3297 family protein [Parasphingopyxis marina]MBC2778319.1 DUF3297 family protein [Parasphingopyxis marina]
MTEPTEQKAADTPPDRLSNNPTSDFYEPAVLERGIGIRFKGRERRDVEEYCLSEGWIRVQAGKTRDRHGNPLTIKLSGEVEAWYEDAGEG